MDKKNYLRKIVESRKQKLSHNEKKIFAEREVKSFYFLLKHFFNFEILYEKK